MNQIEQVTTWIDAAQQKPSVRNVALYFALCLEELIEGMEAFTLADAMMKCTIDQMKAACKELKSGNYDWAFESSDKVGLLDSAVDMMWVSAGLAHMIGDAQGAFAEVARSNHSKFVDGVAKLDANGKVLDKGKLTPDNISHFLHWIEMPVLPKTKPWLEKNAVATTDTASLPASGNNRGQVMNDGQALGMAFIERARKKVTVPQDFEAGWSAALEWAKSGQEPVALEKLFAELLKGTYSGKESYYNDEQISDACYAKGFEIALVAKKKGIELYTHPAPAHPVRLSDEEIAAIYLDCATNYKNVTFANAIQDAMLAKGAEQPDQTQKLFGVLQSRTPDPLHRMNFDELLEELVEMLDEKEAQPAPYDQQALEPCEECGWKTVIPDEGCLNCQRAQPAVVGNHAAAKALHEAVGAIYFADNADYIRALWDVVRALSPEIATLLESDPSGAWHKSESFLNATPQPAVVQQLSKALESVVAIANDAFHLWDSDQDSKVGKLLLALAGGNKGYRADIDAIQAALAAYKESVK